jgi:hypothetical protein
MSIIEDLSIEQREAIGQHHAQVEALRWLQGKAEDQLVKAFIQVHAEMLVRIGYPIDSSGRDFKSPEAKKPQRRAPKIIPPLEGQIDLEQALKDRAY